MGSILQRTFKAGFSTSDITPSGPVKMSGFVIRTEASQGVHDQLFARAAAFADGEQTIVLIVLDLLGADAYLTQLIRRKVIEDCALPGHCIAVTATHTHGAPAVLSRGQLGEAEPKFLDFVAHQASAAARRALNNLEICEIRTARSQETTIASNRRNPAGVTDSSLDVIRFDGADRCLGMFVNFACHPVVLGADNLLITRDYPGVLIDELESHFPSATVLFLTGTAGQLNTGHSAHDSMERNGKDRRSFSEAQRIGKLLASKAQEAAAASLDKPALPPGPVLAASSTVTLNVLPDAVRAGMDSEQKAVPDTPDVSDAGAIRQANFRWSRGYSSLPSAVPVEVQALALCGHAIALFPGEAFVEYGLALKAEFGNRVTTVGYANCAPGYLPTDEALSEGGYEVTEAHRYYGQRGPFGAGTQATVTEAMITNVRKVLPQAAQCD